MALTTVNPGLLDSQAQYTGFKTEVKNGAELQDADGVAMTQEQADAFIATLP